MSSAYAIAGVTTVLQGIIRQSVANYSVSTTIGSDVTISAVAPDRVTADAVINIFFYQVSPNTAWRNAGLPAMNARSERISNPALALDLHYLVSVHGTDDLHAEILLGVAMQSLHERPVFDRSQVRSLLSPPPLPEVNPVLDALHGSGLADQLEQIKVTPEYLSNEDLSKLWSAVQSSFRPSASYMATVVLIEAEESALAPLPVLTRGITVRPGLLSATPCILSLDYADEQTAARLGETVSINDLNLNGPNLRIQLMLRSAGVVADFPATGTPASDRIEFSIPADVTLWRAGVYQLSLLMDDSSGTRIESNCVALTIAPRINLFNAVRNPDNSVSAQLTVSPEVHDNQSLALILGQTMIPAESFTGQTGTVNFEIESLAPGDHWARLRVDGIESILINRGVTPPEFHADQEVSVP